MISAAELTVIVEALLTEGVPPGVVSRALQLDAEMVKKAQSQLRVKRYGTEDLSEYMEQIQWDNLDRVRQIIMNGSAADQVRIASALMGKQMAVAARRTPEKQRHLTDKVMDMFEEMRSGGEVESARSEFVALVGTADDQDEDGEAP